MFNLLPVEEKYASVNIKKMYSEIKQHLGVVQVPLIFQFLANYEKFLVHTWCNVKKSIYDNSFNKAFKLTISAVRNLNQNFYFPDGEVNSFLNKLNKNQKQELLSWLNYLEKINAQLLIIVISLRENMKVNIVPHHKHTLYKNSNAGISLFNPENKLFLMIIKQRQHIFKKYCRFVLLMNRELKNLVKKEEYLLKRVVLEDFSITLALKTLRPIGLSYKDFLRLNSDKYYLDEMIHLVYDVFPSFVPNYLLYSSIMRQTVERLW